ncbi:hypothetical protein EDB84DRAFT_1456218, partial [Lactarius hengduanensis]
MSRVIGCFMSWLYSLVGFLFFYYDSLFLNRQTVSIHDSDPAVLFDRDRFRYLLHILVTFPSVCGHFFFSCDRWGVRSSFSSPSGSSVMALP